MASTTRSIVISVFLFFVAGICEIGGGYLVWLWLRETMSWTLGVIGGFVLFLYGIIPTFQPSHFHRVYAAYGGVFIVMAIFWGWFFEGTIPDKFDILGIVIAIVGVIVIFYILVSMLGGVGITASTFLSNYQIPLRIISLFLLIWALYSTSNKLTKTCSI